MHISLRAIIGYAAVAVRVTVRNRQRTILSVELLLTVSQLLYTSVNVSYMKLHSEVIPISSLGQHGAALARAWQD